MLDDVIAAARRTKQLQKDHPFLDMDNSVSVLQNELRAVHKELKESVAAMAEKAVRVAQPAAAPLAVAATNDKYVAPPSGMCAPQCWCRCFLSDQEGHFAASCPIRNECSWTCSRLGDWALHLLAAISEFFFWRRQRKVRQMTTEQYL